MLKNISIAVIMNTDKLGGAERSIISQMKMIESKFSFDYYVPKNSRLDNRTKLEEHLLEKGFKDLHSFYYSRNLYEISRGKNLSNLIKLIISIPCTIFSLIYSPNFKRYDALYCNGTKAFFFILINSFFKGYKGIIYWHFRDYPPQGFFLKIFKRLIFFNKFLKIRFITNSISVNNAVVKSFDNKIITNCIYNSIDIELQKKNFLGKTIGIVSMFAPWKGIHEIILFSSLFNRELKEIGIENINIYGDDIYQTTGEHFEYGKDLRELNKKYCNDLIKFKGLSGPKSIYSEIDILIHSSIKKEPFGRVIMEAFKANIPVISTGLGGSAELVINEMTGLIYEKNDYLNIFFLIKKLITSDNIRRTLTSNALNKYKMIDDSIYHKLLGVFEEVELEKSKRKK